MMMRTVVFLLPMLLAAAILAGCATPSGEPYSAPEADSENALVYVYRPKTWVNSGCDMTAELNSAERSSLPNGSFVRFDGVEGSYSLAVYSTKIFCKFGPLEMREFLQPGTIHYYRLTSESKTKHLLVHEKKWQLERVRPETAMKELHETSRSYPLRKE